ncbi:(2Fe-2S)-binding protein [Sulfitobacter geojensis]
MTSEYRISLTVNGEGISRTIEPRMSLADFLRDGLQLTGTHLGCEMGACGACLVLMNGVPVHACLVLAAQADGEVVETIEGLNERDVITDLQEAFFDRNALQCGFCTTGMVVNAHAFLESAEKPNRDEIRDAISGNYCRCTGYEAIVDAIENVANNRAKHLQASADQK